MITPTLNIIPQAALPAIPVHSISDDSSFISGTGSFPANSKSMAVAIPAGYFSADFHDPLFLVSYFCFALCAFSFALTAKKFASLNAHEIFKTIMQKSSLDFKNEKELCKEKLSALSNDFENVFIKKFLKRYGVFKNDFVKKFLENFEIAQNVFSQNISDETFCLRSENLKCKKDLQEFLPRKTISTKESRNIFGYLKNASYDVGRGAEIDRNRCNYEPIPVNLKSLKPKARNANLNMGTS